MNTTKTWSVAVLLLGGVLWAIRAEAETETWQDVWQEKAKPRLRQLPRSIGSNGR